MSDSFAASGVMRGQWDAQAQQRIDQISTEIAELVEDGAVLAVQPNQAAWVYAVELSGGMVDLKSGQVLAVGQ